MTGIMLIVIDCFLLFYKRDIIVELINGRPIAQLEIYKLLLPVIILIIAIFLITAKNKKHESAADNT
jgi:hypothetical protein